MPPPLSRRTFLAATGGTALGSALLPGLGVPEAGALTLPPAVRLHPAPHDRVICNPERGLHVPHEAHLTSQPWPIRNADGREQKFPWGSSDDADKWTAAKAQGSTLIYRSYYLDAYRENPFDADVFTALFADDMAEVERRGMKVILMFAYRNPRKEELETDPHKDAVQPPYKDSPTVAQTMEQVATIMPIVNRYAHLVFALYVGFYGVWGENVYTDAFATSGDYHYPNAQDWANRTDLMHAIITQAPDVQHVQFRYCGDIEHYIERFQDDPRTDAGRYRIGLHNDAMAGLWDDLGTYHNFSSRTVAQNRAWVTARALLTPLGGENPAEDQLGDFADRAKGLAELRARHVTYLNGANVPSSWGIDDTLRNQLGYRLRVKEARVPAYLTPRATAQVAVDIENVGWAPPVSHRPMYMRLDSGRNTWWAHADKNATALAPGKVTTVRANVPVPADWPRAETLLSLWLPDAAGQLFDKPQYAIQCASEGWDAERGVNVLGTLMVR